MPLIELKNVNFTYPGRERPALKDLSLIVQRGEFILLCGVSSSGKSTLLRQLSTALTPFGVRTGEVLFDGRPLDEVSKREQATRIGFVQQSLENQIVTDKVWHELAFGLENLGVEPSILRRRVAETASFFGIQAWYEKKVFELSGGQRQILALASAVVMQPDVIIADEPTAQLDPIAAEEFMGILQKLNRETGITVILSEHRLEGVLPYADRVVVMKDGTIACEGTAAFVAKALKDTGDPLFSAMPCPLKVYFALEKNGDVCNAPQTIRDGRRYIAQQQRKHPSLPLQGNKEALSHDGTSIVVLKDLWFRYGRDEQDVLRDLNFAVHQGEFVCVLGGNGVGKSTMLGVITGECTPYRGQARTLGLDPTKARSNALFKQGLAALPQNPQALFAHDTIYDNLFELITARAQQRGESPTRAALEQELLRKAEFMEIADILDSHPYDVSGGEQQRTALAMALLTHPKLLLLDEPTKGMDSVFKEKLAHSIKRLCAKSTTVIMVSHDIEFCAQHADRCALMFNGSIVSEGTPRAFFSGNSHYTTAANRMTRGIFDELITTDEIIARCGG